MTTDSRRALLAILQRTQAQYVAARCRVAPCTVSRWASGEIVPSQRARALLFQNYGIPVDGWRSARARRFEAVRRS